ncbi:hypothetical protein ACN20G_26815 (plasmid) [Streptomyces sp. BI20]|uniref:hypothetical protein n=1 Tax=Streptomyces sp. BI20 TaxID=3403460 RepID=UPI003C78A594
MHNGWQRTAWAAIALTSLLVVSGCSDAREAPRVAGDEGSGKSASAPRDENAIRKAWVDCMREQGQNGVRQNEDGDIVMDASGLGDPGAGAQGSADGYDEASKTCDTKVPGIRQTRKEVNEKFLAQARDFVACARENGYRELPDPDPASAILVIPRNSFDGAKWDAALVACGKFQVSYRIGE